MIMSPLVLLVLLGLCTLSRAMVFNYTGPLTGDEVSIKWETPAVWSKCRVSAWDPEVQEHKVLYNYEDGPDAEHALDVSARRFAPKTHKQTQTRIRSRGRAKRAFYGVPTVVSVSHLVLLLLLLLLLLEQPPAWQVEIRRAGRETIPTLSERNRESIRG